MTLKDINIWPENGIKSALQFRGTRPEQQIMSKICPVECVGKLIYCCSPKLSRQEVEVLRVLLTLSIWMLKSPQEYYVWRECGQVCQECGKVIEKPLVRFGRTMNCGNNRGNRSR